MNASKLALLFAVVLLGFTPILVHLNKPKVQLPITSTPIVSSNFETSKFEPKIDPIPVPKTDSKPPVSSEIRVFVPDGSVVLVNGKPTTSTGPYRRFVANLIPDKRYNFKIVVSTPAGISLYRDVPLAPGQMVDLDFR